MARQKKIVNYLVVQDFLEKVGGQHAIQLVKICEKKGAPITDEEIGKKLPLKITEIRTILNRLHFRGIACYNKKRDTTTGWYSYTWEIAPKRVAELILEEQSEEISKLEQKADFEGGHAFFGCGKKRCEQLPFEIAAEYQFRCPECGGIMEAVDAKKRAKSLKRRVSTMRKEMGELMKYIH